jgi:hypothetical protein
VSDLVQISGQRRKRGRRHKKRNALVSFVGISAFRLQCAIASFDQLLAILVIVP